MGAILSRRPWAASRGRSVRPAPPPHRSRSIPALFRFLWGCLRVFAL